VGAIREDRYDEHGDRAKSPDRSLDRFHVSFSLGGG